jgi:S-adenosylmethionine decarboxylase
LGTVDTPGLEEGGQDKLKALGYHVLLEFFDCDRATLNDLEKVEKALTTAAKRAKAHVVKIMFHKFNPHGVSGVVVISESHFSVHTWPEHGYAAIDIFSCGKDMDTERAIRYLIAELRPGRVTSVEMKRGVLTSRRGAR